MWGSWFCLILIFSKVKGGKMSPSRVKFFNENVWKIIYCEISKQLVWYISISDCIRYGIVVTPIANESYFLTYSYVIVRIVELQISEMLIISLSVEKQFQHHIYIFPPPSLTNVRKPRYRQ